jgi:hypothetical protein
VSRNLHRCALRFPRTASSAFKDMAYGAAIEIPTRPPLWRRILRAIFGSLS